jgi:protein-S-isoprenylcysteine O-methyltransferase Ste14
MESSMILAAMLAYLVAAFAWPTLRVWRRHGVWPIVFAREAAPAQRFLGWLTRGLFAVLLATSVVRHLAGPASLGLWTVPVGMTICGWLLMGLGSFLTILAQWEMGASWRVGIDDRPTALVTTGIFRLVRNPIFSGLLLFLAGYACLMPAWWSLALWVATLTGLRLQIAHEEGHLIALHGAEYLAYAARVGRLVPFVGRVRAAVNIVGRSSAVAGRAH